MKSLTLALGQQDILIVEPCREKKYNIYNNSTSSNLDPVNEGGKEKHKELHGGHVLMVEFGTGIFILFRCTAIVVCETLVPHGLKVGTTATTAAPRPAVSQARLLVALLGCFQKHPM